VSTVPQKTAVDHRSPTANISVPPGGTARSTMK